MEPTTDNTQLETQIESLLFFKAEPVSVESVAKILGKSVSEIENALKILQKELQGRGVRLVIKDGEALLTTAPEASLMIEELTKEELRKDIGKAGLETLTIVLYKGPVTRSEIDYIRGVNSTYILRHLLVRGLVEKISNPKDRRSFLYRPTFELLSHLGIEKIEDMPEYESFRTEIRDFAETDAEKVSLDDSS